MSIKTQIPDSDEFKKRLNSLYMGKWYAFTFLFFGLIPFYTEGKSKITSFLIFIFLIIYLILPASTYVKGYYRFFINSWLMGIFSLVLWIYTSTLFLYQIKDIFYRVDVILCLVFTITYFIEVIKKRDQLIAYKRFISNSITVKEDDVFNIKNWFDDLESSGVDKSFGFALGISLIVAIFTIIIGVSFGGGLMTAKVLINSGYDVIVKLAIASFFIFMGLVVVSFLANDTLKLLAAHQIHRNLDEKN